MADRPIVYSSLVRRDNIRALIGRYMEGATNKARAREWKFFKNWTTVSPPDFCKYESLHNRPGTIDAEVRVSFDGFARREQQKSNSIDYADARSLALRNEFDLPPEYLMHKDITIL